MAVNNRDYLISLAIAKNGDWNAIYKAVSEKEIIEPVYNTDTKVLTFFDSNYPERLKQAYKPPFVLFYKGDIDLLNSRNIVSICFTREPTSEGLFALKTIAKGIEVGISDRDIDYIKRPIVVLPHGLDIDNSTICDILARGGLVISEYPMGVEKTPETCQARTRIIEAIAHKTLVVEARTHSSALLRVTYSLQMGHEVYVVPHSLSDDFVNNILISEGATICTKADMMV